MLTSRTTCGAGIFVAAALLGGCASEPPLAPRDAAPPPRVHRAIAVVPVSGAATGGFAGIDRTDPHDYAKAGAQGLGMGALSGFAAGALLPFAFAAGPAGIAAIPIIFVGAAAAGFVGGYAKGASAIGPSAQTAALQATMASVASGAALPTVMASAVARDIAQWTPVRAQVVTGAVATGGPAADRDGAPGPAGFDGVLQVEITQFGYAARSAGKDIAVYMIAEARLQDAANGQAEARRGLAYMSPWHGAEHWTKADGALTRIELERAAHTLAGRTAEHMFLHTPWRAPAGDAACAIVPIVPPGMEAHVVAGVPVQVDGIRPHLAWSIPPARALRAGAPDSVAVDDLQYDLRIFEEYDWGPGDLVYEREGLPGNGHHVASDLKPATMYFWTVRARYVVDGQPRATRWSATGEPAKLDPLSPQVVFATRIAQGSVSREFCATPQDLAPCGCLDFIPTANWFRFRTP